MVTMRNMSDLPYSTGKPYGHNAPMVDAYGQAVREGERVFLLYSSIKKAPYVIDEINGHIAYLRPLLDARVRPFPVISDQIVKIKHRQVQASGATEPRHQSQGKEPAA